MVDRDETKLVKGIAAIKDGYEFAELSPTEFEELNNVERKLNQENGRDVVILAYEKKKTDLP